MDTCRWPSALVAAALLSWGSAVTAQPVAQTPPPQPGDESSVDEVPPPPPAEEPPQPTAPVGQPQPVPTQPPAGQPIPGAQPPQPQPAPPAAQPQPQPAPPAAQPPTQQPPAPQSQPYPQQQFEGQVSAGGSGDYDLDYAAPEEGGGDPRGGFELPGFAVRLDPLNWLLEGRLGFELEVQLWEFISFELVPVFVVNEDPPLLDLGSLEDVLTQHSDGIGAIAGTSFGVGFWLDGEPFRGTVLRAILTNYAYTFKASDDLGVFDRAGRVERRFVGFLGSYNRWGFFTIGGGIGIGYELNQQERCGLQRSGGRIQATESGCDEHLIALRSGASAVADLNGVLHPVYLEARLSLGVVID